MAAVLAGILTALAVLSWPVPRSAAERLSAVASSVRPGSAAPPGSATPPVSAAPPGSAAPLGSGVDSRESPAVVPTSASRAQRAIVTAAPVGLALFLMLGGVAGLLTGAVAAAGVFAVVLRREPAEVRHRRDRMRADLPFAVDLIVACLRAGQPMSGAVETTALAVGGPVGERLARVGAQMRLGAPPETAWTALADEPALAALARTMIRAAQGGAPVADVLTRLADDARRSARAAAGAAARRAGVQAVAPLGLCFLPAFVFLGVVPMVAGLAGQILLP